MLLPVKTTSLQYMAATIPVSPTPEPSSKTTLSRVKMFWRFSIMKSLISNALRHTCMPTMSNDVRFMCSNTCQNS